MRKTLAVFLVILLLLLITDVIYERLSYNNSKIQYGVTFSPGYANYLNLDWQKIYTEILDELKVRNLRLTGYWDILEIQPGRYDFSQTDFMLDEAGKRVARVTLVLGARQPRWSECHIPAWANNLSIGERQQKILEFVAKVVDKYKNHPAVVAWQVENEPFVSWFGENCDPPDRKFLQTEVNMVKKLDTTKQVIITDSGEWSSWVPAMKSADILGISLYRKSYNQVLNAYITYPLPSWMYPLKSSLVRMFTPQNKTTIISELQAEPWVQQGIPETVLEKQRKLFSVQDFKDNIKYAKRTGFNEMYLWGVEWWYYMAENGHPEYLDYAKTLF